ncbi:MAG: acyltransferase domain-containing protein, partial [Cyclobacteriaceae bacterium]
GISSFGIGGTNIHAILQEAPKQRISSESEVYKLFLLSAKSRNSLKNYASTLTDFVVDHQQVNLSDLSFTLKTGRQHHRYRSFFLCQNLKELTDQLEKISLPAHPIDSTNHKIVFMFSGQGSQYLKMGKQIYLHHPYFRSIMDEGFKILLDETGIDHRELLGYTDKENNKEELLKETSYTQPLMFLLQYAFARFLIQLGVKPSQMIGHSLGEYTAACISEVFSFQDGLRLVTKRARLMAAMERGAMLSIQLAAEKVSEILPGDISIAAVNTESSCVVSGSFDDIKRAEGILSAKEIAFSRLHTSHAFHSSLMDPVLSAYERELNKIKLSTPKQSFISCHDGKPIDNKQVISTEYWLNHLRETVNFSKGLDYLLKDKYDTFIEIGSAKTLSGFLKQNKNFDNESIMVSVLKHPTATKDDSFYLLSALGTIWNNGIGIDWNKYYAGKTRNKVSAPTYEFDKVRFPARVDPFKKLYDFYQAASGDKINIEDLFSQVSDLSEYNAEPGSGVQEKPESKSEYIEAETKTEQELVTLWESFFGYKNIGINDDFFDLGGDSLKAVTLLKRVHKALGVEISVGDFYEKSNIRQLADEIDLAIEIRRVNSKDIGSKKSNQVRL